MSGTHTDSGPYRKKHNDDFELKLERKVGKNQKITIPLYFWKAFCVEETFESRKRGALENGNDRKKVGPFAWVYVQPNLMSENESKQVYFMHVGDFL